MFPVLLLLYQHHVLKLNCFRLGEPCYAKCEEDNSIQMAFLLNSSANRCFSSLRSWWCCCKELDSSSKKELYLSWVFTAVNLKLNIHSNFCCYFVNCSSACCWKPVHKHREPLPLPIQLWLTCFALLGDVAKLPALCCRRANSLSWVYWVMICLKRLHQLFSLTSCHWTQLY